MDQERTYRWVQDRLRELNSGTIAETDRRQLEAMAKEDPFVADALEGYDAHPDHDHTAYLESLAQRIKPHARERRKWLMPNLAVTAVAASLILIVGFWAVMSRINTDEKNKQAINETEQTVTLPPALTDSIDLAANEEQPELAAQLSTPEKNTGSITSAVNSSGASNSTERITEKSARAQKTTNEPLATKTTDVIVKADQSADTDEKKTVSPPASAVPAVDKNEPAAGQVLNEAAYANQMDPKLEKQRVTGTVTDENGDPLYGAFLSIQGTNLSTLSDEHGRFDIILPSPTATVNVSHAGFANLYVDVKQGEKDVELNLLSMVDNGPNVMAGKAADARSQQAKPKITTVTIAMDENQLFLDYLKTNSKYPLADQLNRGAKRVSVEFIVNADGHPSQVKVVKSSGTKSLDDEAERLIRKGPDWECGEYPCKVNYEIYFQ